MKNGGTGRAVQWVTGLIVAALAIFFGVARGVAWVGHAQMEEYTSHIIMPRVEVRIDEKIDLHKATSELAIQNDISEINAKLARIEALLGE